MMMNRLSLWALLLLAGSTLGDINDIKEVLRADPSLHNLKACGSCKIVSLPETTPCWGTTAVVWASGCQTMGCLCDQAYRQKRTKWIKDEVQDLCGIKDTVTPQATVDWFNTFCDAQLAILPASSPDSTPTARTPTQSPSSGGGSAGSSGSGDTTITNGPGTVVNCPNVQECNVGVTGGSSVNSNSLRLEPGLVARIATLSLMAVAVAMSMFF